MLLRLGFGAGMAVMSASGGATRVWASGATVSRSVLGAADGSMGAPSTDGSTSAPDPVRVRRSTAESVEASGTVASEPGRGPPTGRIGLADSARGAGGDASPSADSNVVTVG